MPSRLYVSSVMPVIKLLLFQIHVDRYKSSIYTHLYSDPLLGSLCTLDAASTRFHACERFNRCEFVDVDESAPNVSKGPAAAEQNMRGGKQRNSTNKTGERVVYVNPVSSMSAERWQAYLADTRRKLTNREEVNCLVNFSPRNVDVVLIA